MKPMARALILTGSTIERQQEMAKKLAEFDGAMATIAWRELVIQNRLALAVASRPQTLIVMGMASGTVERACVHHIVKTGEIEILRENGSVEKHRIPNFIFCSGLANPMSIERLDRRFSVMHLK